MKNGFQFNDVYQAQSNVTVFRGPPLYATLSGSGEIQKSVEHFVHRTDLLLSN